MATADAIFPYLTRLSTLSKRLNRYKPEKLSEEDREDREREERMQEGFLAVLRKVCDVVRSAADEHAPLFDEIVEKARQVLDKGINIGTGEHGLFACVPSFAHTDDEVSPMISDEIQMIGAGTVDLFYEMMIPLFFRGRHPPPKPGPSAWDRNTQPHPQSTRLSRFRPSATVNTSENTPLANLIHQARCEIMDLTWLAPSQLVITPGASCMAFASSGGWKGRDPIVNFLRFDETVWEFPDIHTMRPKLGGTASALALDEERKLIFVGDYDRVKSFSWDPERKRAAVHTLDSRKYSGPLTILPGGRITRAGEGRAAIWHLDSLETHGPKNQQIGETYNAEDSWRNVDGDEVELSAGSIPTSTVNFVDEKHYTPGVWHLHRPSGNILCGETVRKKDRKGGYTCLSIDLEHGGKAAARYLGHCEDIKNFSTSDGDPNVFATACCDGNARLYDIRHPLPVMTLDSEQRMGTCSDVIFIHPDGVPTVFTAGTHTQQIKMYDIRGRAVLYELGTGNNAVVSMAWDARRSALWAGTRCEYYDRHYDYRKAKVPKWGELDYSPSEQEDTSMDVDEDDADRQEDSGERRWPKKAFHGEDFYGYTFDAGQQRLCKDVALDSFVSHLLIDGNIDRYGFKETVDPQRLPEYGGKDDWYW
ncbi:hypothetical protein OBBRIDRAFT_839492 [Obba rivulosa]|uniref:Uncharacterized protein n=1 Tax=Obba rivulosa TaxID=1052685 RepID=A0A8E2AMV6_9APHY|nr:hypothetical protein OBBRIDRAFT_839492 [Obba rivulosa]